MKKSKTYPFKSNKLWINTTLLWSWTDVAVCLRIYKQSEFTDYYVGIDIQLLWLNIWIQCFKKKRV